MEQKQPNFLIGVANICKYFNFGRDFFFECLRLGLPCKKITNRYVVSVKQVENFIEKQMKGKKNHSIVSPEGVLRVEVGK